MKLSVRTLVLAGGLGAVLTLVGCSTGGSGSPGGSESTTPTTTPVTAPVSACPDGFVDAYVAAYAQYYQEVSITEIPATDFRPAYLAPFLDGGCAIRIVGTSPHGTANDRDEGYALGANVDGITAALVAEGYFDVDDGLDYGHTFQRGDGQLRDDVDFYEVKGVADYAMENSYFPGDLIVLTSSLIS
ncbi:MAG: hypothetical protein ABIR17_00625 [Pseudolysinimonas sp.]|uniref:hypothetical protein n=1 Tax=Pseudolysinimonas sp. TaxID=2680009 RepID=UPI003265CE11